MFVDLVGSTRLSQQLDPEEFGDLIKEYRIRVAREVQAYGGRVARYFGDGILAYFGFPSATEHDAVRGVRAGLGIVAAMQLQPLEFARLHAAPMRIRIGIETGLVLAGAFASGDAIEPMAAIGDAANIAAHLQQLAAPNTIVVGPTTARLVGAAVRLRLRAETSLKGLSEPLAVFDVLGLAPENHEAEGPPPTRFADRDSERAALWQSWTRAKAGQGCVVLIEGEAGMGKSRIVADLRARIGSSERRWLELAGTPFDADSAFAPVARILRDELRLRHVQMDNRAAVLAQLADLLGVDAESTAAAAELLDLLPASSEPPAHVRGSVARKRSLLIGAVCRWMLVAPLKRSTVLFIEDLHWIDSSTAELISGSISRVEESDVLMIATMRPGPPPSWAHLPHVTRILLGPLPAEHVQSVIAEVSGGAVLPARLLADLTERVDGVPLYAEELTRAALGRASHGHGRFPSASVIPETLRDALMARLDHLSIDKAIVQTAAVVGRAFAAPLLTRLVDLPPGEVIRMLEVLVKIGILFRRSSATGTEYVFRHHLFRDVAYETLLVRRRQVLHAAVADLMMADDEVASRPDVIAAHLSFAGRSAIAADYYFQAASIAQRRGAFLEAETHCEAVDALLPDILESDRRRSLELQLEMQRGAVLLVLRGYAAPEVGRTYARAVELSHEVGDWKQQYAALWGQSAYFGVHGPFSRARDIGVRLLALAREHDEPLLTAEAERRLGLICFMQGEMTEAASCYERAATEFANLAEPLTPLFGTRPYLLTQINRAWLLWYLGEPERAMQDAAHAAEAARGTHDLYTEVFALGIEAAICQLRDDIEGTRRAADSCIAISERQLFPYWAAWGEVFAGWATMAAGDEAGLERLRGGLARYRETGAVQLDLNARVLLADAFGRLGDWTRARDAIQEVLSGDAVSARYALATAHIVHARILAATGDVAAGLAAFDTAAGIARSQGATMLERAAIAGKAEIEPAPRFGLRSPAGTSG